jgi:hypothetical protein
LPVIACDERPNRIFFHSHRRQHFLSERPIPTLILYTIFMKFMF